MIHLKKNFLIVIILITKSSFAQFSTTPGNISQESTGNVGIGFPVYIPSSLLQVKNGSVLFEGNIGITPVSGAGTRLMWIPTKNAFRAGSVSNSQWDEANIGMNSFATGFNTTASAARSFACGLNTIASGLMSFATGSGTVASQNYSFASGNGTTASGAAAAVFGGYSIASGSYTATFGYFNVAQSSNSFVIGRYNYNPGTYSTTSWITSEPLFVIGNGTSATATNNALTVLKNGNVLINKVTQLNPTYKLDINGKIRASEIVVNTTGADFVFENSYVLMPLGVLEQSIKKNKHLPGISSASEMKKDGVGLAELNISLLQKTEELTLYIIDLNKRIELLEEVLQKNSK